MKEELGKNSQSTISISQAFFIHLCCGLALAVGFWVAHNVYSFNLIFHPTNTLRLIWAIESTVVILLFSCCRQKPEKCSYLKAIARGLLGLPVGAVLNALGALALGAPVGLQYFEKTVNWSLMMSSFTFVPVACVYGSVWTDWHRLFACTKPKGPLDFMLCLPAHGAVIGAWFGAWPMPLDWERPWQDWPICVSYGAMAGYVAGMVGSLGLALIHAGGKQLKADLSSTMALILQFMLSLVVFLLHNHNGVQCHGEKKQLLNLLQRNNKRDITASTCLSHKSKKEKGATILEMKHRDYCDGGVEDRNKLLQKRLILDDRRVQSLQAQIKNMASAETQEVSEARLPLTSGVELGTLNYIVTVEIGGRNMTVIVDTGSDLTWVQCQPCKSCYEQKEPLFDPSTSPSFGTVSCNSSECQSLEFATGNMGICGKKPPTCNYIVSYGDGSYTRGELAHDHLNLGKTSVDGFIFGCGRNNKGLFGGTSGLLGLGRSSISLVSQTSAIFGGLFSYCMPSTESGASGSLVLGGNSSVYNTSSPISYTRIIPNPKLSTFYFVNLTGASLGGVTMQDSSFGKTPMLIDSGTVITRLPPTIYKALKAEFQKQFSSFPTAPAFSILDTCFNLSAYQEVEVPTLKLQFEGNAEMNVDVAGVFYFVKTDASQVCLALASLTYEDEIGIIANYQQRNQRVICDTNESKLGFAQESCSFA